MQSCNGLHDGGSDLQLANGRNRAVDRLEALGAQLASMKYQPQSDMAAAVWLGIGDQITHAVLDVTELAENAEYLVAIRDGGNDDIEGDKVEARQLRFF